MRDEIWLLQPGTVLAGKYRVERVLGRGGMGVVVAATHVDLGQPRAIKLLLPSAFRHPSALGRFLEEARAAARLGSEHVVRIFDVGRLDSGLPYIVMEQLAGIDLAAMLDERGPLPVGEAVDYVLQALEAVAEAHAAGIVHRDLKPANLVAVTTSRGERCIKVVDFGLSKTSPPPDRDDEPPRTNPAAAFGTPTYMSPEQCVSTANVDARTDLWSLGIVLYELLTDALPFFGESTRAVVRTILEEEPLPPSRMRPDIPPELDEVVLACLAKDPAARPADAAALARALEPFGPDERARILTAHVEQVTALPTGDQRLPSPSVATEPVRGRPRAPPREAAPTEAESPGTRRKGRNVTLPAARPRDTTGAAEDGSTEGSETVPDRTPLPESAAPRTPSGSDALDPELAADWRVQDGRRGAGRRALLGLLLGVGLAVAVVLATRTQAPEGAPAEVGSTGPDAPTVAAVPSPSPSVASAGWAPEASVSRPDQLASERPPPRYDADAGIPPLPAADRPPAGRPISGLPTASGRVEATTTLAPTSAPPSRRPVGPRVDSLP